MGISSSRPADNFAELIHRRKPEIPQPEQEYTKEKIEQGLRVVAKHLADKKRNVSIVTVGGAVNTVLLKTRASTGDVDFFYSSKDSQKEEGKIMHEVVEAGKQAEKTLKLGDQWLNNHTVAFIEETAINDLYAEALKQNEKVFSEKGLTVYAAPWHYALMTKLDRAGKRGAKKYDMSDAVDYLGRLITKSRKGKAVKRSELEGWAKKYKPAMPTKELIDDLAQKYKAKTGKDGVING